MHRIRFIFAVTLVSLVSFALAACSDASPATTPVPQAPPSGAMVATAAPQTQPQTQVQSSQCKNGGRYALEANDKPAAQVNDTVIPLSVYERQAAQAQAALVQQGVDPNSEQGKEAVKGLRAQVLAQLIDDALLEQEAVKQNISPSDNEINDRVLQVINDAGGQAKFFEYLTKNQLTLEDLCQQIRANVFSEAMMTRVTQALPTQTEQVHVAHILFAKKQDADDALTKLKAGADFGALAKQVSQDEATRDNGGDLGWFPRDVMPPEFEQAAFALQPGEISGVVSTQLGLHIVKVLERDAKRALTPELLQNQRLAAFNTWLEGVRSKAKIVKSVQE
jgi:parvulin-like peptidyl-prolyl isomerase